MTIGRRTLLTSILKKCFKLSIEIEMVPSNYTNGLSSGFLSKKLGILRRKSTKKYGSE